MKTECKKIYFQSTELNVFLNKCFKSDFEAFFVLISFMMEKRYFESANNVQIKKNEFKSVHNRIWHKSQQKTHFFHLKCFNLI